MKLALIALSLAAAPAFAHAPTSARAERVLEEVPSRPCSGLHAAYRLSSLSYVSPTLHGDVDVRVSFPGLESALCKNKVIGDVEYFIFQFEEGEKPTLNGRPILSMRILHYTEKPQNSFVKIYTGLSDLSTITYFMSDSTVNENIETNAPLVDRPARVER